jgi:predicted PurR-regulated permease PerM
MYLVPKIMGKVTGLGPAAILLSLSFWGALMGFIGMIIALPLTTLGISCYKHYVLHEPFASEQMKVSGSSPRIRKPRRRRSKPTPPPTQQDA